MNVTFLVVILLSVKLVYITENSKRINRTEEPDMKSYQAPKTRQENTDADGVFCSSFQPNQATMKP